MKFILYKLYDIPINQMLHFKFMVYAYFKELLSKPLPGLVWFAKGLACYPWKIPPPLENSPRM